jgi:hypothetical protein
LVDAGSRGEAVGTPFVAGGAVVGKLELAGVAAVFPLSLSLSGLRARTVSVARAGGAPRQAARWLGRASKPGRPSFIWDLFHFLIFVTVLSKVWKNEDLGFYLPKNYEINFVRIYMMWSILEKYKSGM